MGRTTSEKVGRGICPNASCAEPVTYRKSAGGMLTHKCDCCDSSGYAEPGGSAFKERMASIKNATPEPDDKTAAPPAPGSRAAGGFQLGQL
ncbi:hypothetical protein [Polaromonas sp. YR568]|uniref:hypothetical protein n=1 Tax=Polaromonas sp. YR568 TaxID=1855301 RepID=UPI003137C3D1